MSDDISTTVQTWLDEIKEAKKREKDFRKNGKEINDIYVSKDPKKTPFNILFSNTETVIPAVFTNIPRPVVKRRFHTEDSPVVAAASKAGTRILEYLLDTNIDGYAKFDRTMKNVVSDSLLPGRGVSPLKYDAKITGEGDLEQVEWEAICMQSRKWDRFYHGYALTWEDVPWIAYEDFIDETEALELFGAEMVAKIDFTEGQDDDEDEPQPEELKHIGNKKTAQVFQIWDKSDRTIRYISPQYKDGYLLEEEDPYGITGFFNCPRPLQFIDKSNDLVPTAPYEVYRNQAEELNFIQGRINRVIKAIKARGAYNGALGDELEKLMEEDDNALIATDEAATLADGGFDKNIWFMPIEKLIATAQQLFIAREQCKQVIYEITGISDIVRGQSKASETLGAQQIKAQWGSMRVKDKQKAVQDYARDALRIMLDMAVNNFSMKTWMNVTGLPFPTNEQRAMTRMQLKAQEMQHKKGIQRKMQQMAMQGMDPRQAPPPPPFKPDPKLAQRAQSPSWEEILQFLTNDYNRSFKVDIETNSTLEAEATEDKQMVAEFMNAMAQFLNGIGPMIEQGIMPFQVAQSMLLQISRRFRFGDEVEEEIKQMKPPKPKEEKDPKMEKAQKQLQDGFKKLQAEREAMQKEEKRVTDAIIKQTQQLEKAERDLELDRIKFNSEKAIFKAEQNAANAINNAKMDADQKVANEKVKAIVKDGERRMQSLLDKHMSSVKEMMTQRAETEGGGQSGGVTVIPVNEPSSKSVSIVRDDSGAIVGANIQEPGNE